MPIEVEKIIEAVRFLTPAQLSELLSAPEFRGAAPAGATRAEIVNSIRGKYAHVRTSSDDFAERKRQEIELEDSS